MANIAEQLTSLNTNLNTINAEVGNQAIKIAQIKAKVENLPDAGSGGTDLPKLTNPATAGNVVEGMDFIDSNGNRVVGEIIERGSEELSFARLSDTEYSVVGLQGFYLDGIDMTFDAVDAYDTGYEHGLAEASDALEALCDWSAMVDSNSVMLVTIRNLHPTYRMTCTLDFYWYDSETEEYHFHSSYDLEISNDDEIVWNSFDEADASSKSYLANINNIRWIAE